MTPTEKLSQQIDGACIARMLDQYSKVKDGKLHLWKHLAIALEDSLYQALTREARLEAAVLEAGLEVSEPWEDRHPMVPGETQAERAARLYPNAGPIDGP